MGLTLSSEQREIQVEARAFAAEKIQPKVTMRKWVKVWRRER